LQTDFVQPLIVQNGNAYEAGRGAFWNPVRRIWEDNSRENRDVLRSLLQPGAIKARYTEGVRDCTRLDPLAWLCDQMFLERTGASDLLLDLFYDYRTNVELYPRFQQWFRENQLPTLVL
jgi:hypothetical protein